VADVLFCDLEIEGQLTQYDIVPDLREDYAEADEAGREDLRRQAAEYIALAHFSVEMGVPFCVEPNPYYRSPHAVLHEMGHWRIKPDSYNQVYRELSARDFEISVGDVVIEPPFGEGEVILGLMMYAGNNDRIPDWDLPDGADPTPHEKANRLWCRYALAYLSMQDPVETGRSNPYQVLSPGVGDKIIAKGASYRTWSPATIHAQRAMADVAAFGFDPANGVFRPDETTLELPHVSGITVQKLRENVAALQEQHNDRVDVLPEQMKDWDEHIEWKFGDYLG
jgi:hypothetical protein